MDLKEKFPWYNTEYVSLIDENFSDIVKFERDCLVKIFECKDNIDYQIDCISIREKKSETQKELLDNLVDSRRNLFKKFFINYCKSKKLLKYSDSFSDDLEKYEEVEDVVRYNMWVRIFNDVNKDAILDFFDKPLEYGGIYGLIDDFVSKFVDSIDGYISKVVPDSLDEAWFHEFLWYFANIVSKLVKLKICDEKWNMDLDALFDLISWIIYASIDKDTVNRIYTEFSSKWSDETWDDTVDDEFDEDIDIVISWAEELVKGTYIKSYDITNEFDFLSLDWAKIADDAWNFISKNLKAVKWFNAFDEKDFVEKIYGIYLDDESYEIWKKMFLRRVKFPVQTWDLKLMNIKESDSIMSFISLMKEKYPKAKNHIWNIWTHKFKEKKLDFLKMYEEKLVSDLSDVLNHESFKKLSLVQLFKIMYVYLWILKLNKVDLSVDFEEYIKQYLEQCFVESHKSVIDKQEAKASRQEQSQEMKEPDKVDTVEEQKVEQVQKKEWLSKELLEDIDFYFTHVDLKFSDEEKSSIIKVLEKLPWKYYKRSWFKDFELNDIFFQNLDKNWYICEDEVVDEDSTQYNWSNVSTENVGESDNRGNSLLSNSLLLGFDKIEDIWLKIDKYFEVLKLLWYSFHKKEQKIKDKILELSKSNASFFTSFSSVIVNLVNWAQILEKKEKRWQNMPVYCLDIWWTWYRLVCLSKWDGEKKAIFDIMSHWAYITFLDKKCS